ncbi:TniQ family protein [Pseudomonas sp. NA-150]|uniref:TniQ family protein n=1 Tax=Pseudomonas sp. NA-150 TaxID=3367525 RepID=UPI0037C7EC8E
MWRRWIESSANQEPLERVLDSICLHGGSSPGGNAHGKLIIVQGEAGAGASAFASRLHSTLVRRKIRCVFVPRHPFSADFALYSHYLKSLGLPDSSIDLKAGQKVTLHYEAAIQLRRYQAVICEDAHDFFFRFNVKLQNIYDSLQLLIQPPNGQCIILCGLRDPLTIVGHRAKQMGIEVEYADLEAMPCDQSYLEFVNDIAAAAPFVGDRGIGDSDKRLRQIMPPISSMVGLPFANPNVQQSILSAPDAHRASSEPQTVSEPTHMQPPNETNGGPKQTQLGAASCMHLDPDPLTGRELDVAILHAHTKGLVGNTVSVVLGLSAVSMLKMNSIPGTPGTHSTQHNDVPRSAALSSPRPLEDPKVAQGEVAAHSAVPSISSSDEAFSDAKTAADGSLLYELGRFDATSGTQILLPFMMSEHRQIDWQLELGLNLTDPRETAPLVTVQAAAAEKPVVTGAPSNLVHDFRVHLALRNSHRDDRHKLSKAFSGFLTPIHDETLGSWLSRNATSSSVTGIHTGFLDWCTRLLRPMATPALEAGALDRSQLWNTQNVPAQADFIEEQALWNPEGLLGKPQSLDPLQAKPLECDDLYISETFLQAFPDLTRQHITAKFHLPINAMSPENNRRFCAQCLADDVAAMRAPGLRQAWRYRGAVLCTAHRQPVMLQKLEKGNLSKFSGAWQAYMQHTTRGHFDHGVGLVLRSSSGYQVASVETRICRIVRRIQDWVEHAPAKPTDGKPSKYALYFLLGVFLYQANLVSEGGAARALLRGERGSRLNTRGYEKPSAAQMVKNIESASPRSLAIAYLLLGLAFDVIAEEDLVILRRTLVFTTSAFPTSRGELKTITRCFQAYHCDAIWSSALKLLPIDDLVHLAWLLKDHL